MDSTRKRIFLTVALCVLFSTTLLAGFIYKLSQPRLLTDAEMREYGAMELSTPRRFSDFKLKTHTGEAFTKEDLEGKWTLIFFGFANCPDICPTTMGTLARVYKELDEATQKEVQVLMVSVDPERDTPEKLAQYVPYFHPDFIGVTGDPAQILALTTQLNVVYSKVALENGGYTVDHSGNIVVINPKGDYHGFFRPPFEEGSVRVALRSMLARFED